jgi:hypothetical protein
MSRDRWTCGLGRQAGLALLMLLSGPGLLQAGEPAIKVSVVAILASDRDNKVDEQLKNIADEVQRRVDPKLTSFRLGKMSCKSVKMGERDTFDLGNDQAATITIESKDDQGRIQLRVAPPLMGEITYQITCGKFLPIVTRYKTRNNELLLLAVRVQPCNGKK